MLFRANRFHYNTSMTTAQLTTSSVVVSKVSKSSQKTHTAFCLPILKNPPAYNKARQFTRAATDESFFSVKGTTYYVFFSEAAPCLSVLYFSLKSLLIVLLSFLVEFVESLMAFCFFSLLSCVFFLGTNVTRLDSERKHHHK